MNEILKPNDIEPIVIDLEEFEKKIKYYLSGVFDDLESIIDTNNLFLFGGTVNKLINTNTKFNDFDFFTTLTIDEMRLILNSLNIASKSKLRGQVINFTTTNRFDVDIRGSGVRNNLSTYADFTVSSILVNNNLEYSDPLQGLQDLASRRLRYTKDIITNVNTNFPSIVRSVKILTEQNMWIAKDEWEQTIEAAKFFDSSECCQYEKESNSGWLLRKLSFLRKLNNLQRFRAVTLLDSLKSERINDLVKQTIK